MAAAARLLIHSIRDVTVVNIEDASILDLAQVESLGQQLYELVEDRNCRKLILDFTKVRFLSSSALGVLVNLQRKTSEIKGTLVICALRSELMKVFEITKLKKLFTFCDDETAALAVFNVVIG
ncbi:MAG TPA: STAS domain-containing protein [Phycisphaerae bacterium]|nr:STAS domain-containing protein [Phycisphaerae bacterium]HRY70173.1 STAS domain-containing protein [Phycisphaerae bacterium]HSA27388.1 STAS domain-containing protein [Phycisphaerae bacterium]